MNMPNRSAVIHNLMRGREAFLRIVIVALAVACLMAIDPSAAADVQAPVKQFTDIPAQGLSSALQALAKERKFQVVYVSEEINPKSTGGATGELTAEEALHQILL